MKQQQDLGKLSEKAMHTKHKSIHEVTRRSLGDHRFLSSPSARNSPSLENRLGAGARALAQSAVSLQHNSRQLFPPNTQLPALPGASSLRPHLLRARASGSSGAAGLTPAAGPHSHQTGAGDSEGHPRPCGPPPPAPRARAAARPGPGYLGGPGGAAPPAAAHSRARCRSCRPARPPPPPARPRRRAGSASATASRRGLRRAQTLTASGPRGSQPPRTWPSPSAAPGRPRPVVGRPRPGWGPACPSVGQERGLDSGSTEGSADVL